MQEDLSLRLKGCKMVRASQRSHGALCTNNIATTAAAAAESLVGPSVIFLGYGLGNDFRRFGPAPHISSTPPSLLSHEIFADSSRGSESLRFCIHR